LTDQGIVHSLLAVFIWSDHLFYFQLTSLFPPPRGL